MDSKEPNSEQVDFRIPLETWEQAVAQDNWQSLDVLLEPLIAYYDRGPEDNVLYHLHEMPVRYKYMYLVFWLAIMVDKDGLDSFYINETWETVLDLIPALDFFHAAEYSKTIAEVHKELDLTEAQFHDYDTLFDRIMEIEDRDLDDIFVSASRYLQDLNCDRDKSIITRVEDYVANHLDLFILPQDRIVA